MANLLFVTEVVGSWRRRGSQRFSLAPLVAGQDYEAVVNGDDTDTFTTS